MLGNLFQKKRIEVPLWANQLTEKNYPVFIVAIEAYFAKKGDYILNDEIGIVECNGTTFGLTNIAQKCAQIKPAQYPAAIRELFDRIFANFEFNKEFSAHLDDFEYIKPYLATRLYHRNYLEYAGIDETVATPFCGDLYKTLVFDFPEIVRTVKPEELKDLEKTPEELLSIGEENIRSNYGFTIEKTEFLDDIIYTVNDRHFFVGNLLFVIENYPQLLGREGTLVAVPTRDTLLMYPMEDAKAILVLNHLFNVVPRLYETGPGSLSNEIFWYHDGAFEKLNYEYGEKIQFYVSEELTQALNRLAEKDEKKN
ncbi:MAG: hypothetical protein LBR25_02040 [Erysipelotrichaceae bacterium]|jgi:hypothetical protein|nr:hypothetical protein [Erysipelotrichaceae bacterium]